MQAELTKYSDYYKSKHSGYVLDWNHGLGTMILRARFRSGLKELSVSMYQGIALLLFSTSIEISFRDIREQTNMSKDNVCTAGYVLNIPLLLDHDELRRTLQSLACGKKKVLKKIPPGKEVDDTDVFRYNADFEDPHPKIHINSIQAKESVSGPASILLFHHYNNFSPRNPEKRTPRLKMTGSSI
jgi:cullin-4